MRQEVATVGLDLAKSVFQMHAIGFDLRRLLYAPIWLRARHEAVAAIAVG